MRSNRWINVFALAVMGSAVSPICFGSTTTLLYDGSAGGTPQSQGWLIYAYNPLETAPTTTTAGGATTLDTTSNYDTMGGYSNTNPISLDFVNSSFPTLNPATGFTVSFDLQINSESHTIDSTVNSNRAGFSVIVLGDDSKGIELGFWGDDVWAQTDSPLFTHGADVQFNTESSSHDYALSILNGVYTLSADGTAILTGPTQDYTSDGSPPYTLANYIFVGDDTTEAQASATLSSLSVTVPEPATALGLVVLAGAALPRRRRR
ncbi:MAG TPA: PEP-CTERM sorting domain-containing protein [Tepidisphaeraceae bacterium]|jgi:hypothetical protein|nr:PEP-CTERM sorting domain-containing protein [Tepidisphaeraceae bacterium]